MSTASSILLLDDGELSQAKEILEELQMEFEHLSGEQIAETTERPSDLLVTSRARSFNLAEAKGPEENGEGPVWICIHNQDFLPFRDRLREMGVHYLVHSSVDRESLRLLFLHALYRGPQKRSSPRLPVGSRVCFRIGPLWRPATLTELSTDGCRLVSSHRPAPGRAITVHLLPDLGGGSLLELKGSVVRVELDPQAREPGQVGIGVTLEETEPETRDRLQTILEGRVIGSLVTRLQEEEGEASSKSEDRDSSSEPEASESAACEAESEPTAKAEPEKSSPKEFEVEIDPREHVRGSYAQPVPAMIGDVPRIILGRDLSVEGMRIERHPDLILGSSVRVALYGRENEEPLTLDARVARDDGERGFLLRFLEMKPDDAFALEEIVSELPPLEALSSADGESRPVIISTLVPLD
jgi:hypothetical protein